ncbi:MAG: hypothetical protein IJB24_03680 [Clostridia bacterium]|nr:hypothetical protein [Clostridia bacterium]
MKRKALITATAVLLVAVMCLATASYAWFTTSTTSGVSSFDLSISGSEGALQLAPAQMGNKYAAGAYSDSLTLASWSDLTAEQTESDRWAVKPSDNKLTAVSTVDGKAFYPATYANNVWTSQAAAKDGYLLLSFWVKAPTAGTATITFTTTTANDTFKQATKLGLAVTAGTPGAVNEAPALTTYDLLADTSTDLYRPVAGVGAVSKKVDGKFVPNDDAAANFGAQRTAQAEYANNQTIVFQNAGEEQLVTVAIWLEGMDAQCQGNWTASGSCAISLGWTAA